MYLIRAFEQRTFDLTREKPSPIAGSVHLCAGQEAVPVGVMATLRPGDQVVATYRGHGWAIASGLPVGDLLAEICQRETGINGGRTGSAMITAPWQGFIGENSIVGAGVPIGCGTALASLMQGNEGVTVVTFGDGAMSQGALHEGLIFAAYRNLPIVFICENNGWAEMTPASSINKVERLSERAAGYGMSGTTIDGTDPFVVRDAIQLATDRARSGLGPSLVECVVPRLWGHYNRDIQHYRPKADKANAEAADPLEVMASRLIASRVADSDTLSQIRREVDRELDAIQTRVLDDPFPRPDTAREHIVAAPSISKRDITTSCRETEQVTYIKAVNEALRRELASRPEALVFGEDLGKAGGIFGATRYLQRDFGVDRVFDTPIAESAILGSAVGLAISGMKPIVEIMWADFLLVALDQIINQAANVRYATQGRCTAPIVVRTQQGVTPGSCAQHSQSLEALLFHIPGIKLGLPATPQDAYDMLRAAVADPDPVVIIESRSLYQTSASVHYGDQVAVVGGASLRREGSDVVIITWATGVQIALDVANTLADRGITVGVLDLRWLSPLDDTAIDDAVKRCGGRAIVLHEANITGGVGAEIAARISERHSDAKVRRIGTPDTRIPSSPVLQSALIPNAVGVEAAVLGLLEQ
ncbi:alpha-ketoacid dehydrogenase subunit alpha/beta [Kineobactrum salinum]|nr:alpha-ketoacid dehydrogenase subunit alpha/beta [Kineobactrum salinum]